MTTPLKHRYVPRGTCLDIFTNRDAELLISGPAGTGKSRACLEKLNAMAMKFPGMRGLIVRKTAESLTASVLNTWRKAVIPELLANGDVKWYSGSAQEPGQFKYSNGSTILLAGMDKTTRILSTEYDMIYVNEANELSLNDWETLSTRLRNGVIYYQQLMADCNPDKPTHWLKQRADRGVTRLMNSKHEDNPTLFKDDGAITEKGKDYIGRLDKLTGVNHQRFRLGLWVAAEGIIYDEYDSTVNVVDNVEIGDDWARYWSVDFGYTNPFVLQCWAEDPDGRLYLYRELYRTQRLVEDHAKDIMKIVAPKGNWKEPKPAAVICDHDAEGRATLERFCGLKTRPAMKKVNEGIEAVSVRLRAAEDGKPRLFLCRDALVKRDPAFDGTDKPASTIEEIAGYVWDIGEKKAKEAPVKVNDHGCDAMRYVVAYVDLKAKPRVRFIQW